jgi:Ceramidase
MNVNLLSVKNWREWLICSLTFTALGAVFSFPPVPQNPNYHQFADSRNILGIQNFFNVISNMLFIFISIFGLIKYYQNKQHPSIKQSYLIFCFSTLLVGIGSAYYHYSPTPYSLVWDRLPMTLAFMALFSMVISDRIAVNFGKKILWPLLITGIISVWYWYWSEIHGIGDLRPYIVIQFLPMVLIPIILLLYPSHLMNSKYLWATLFTYILAKGVEHFDLLIYEATGLISGHSIKHILGAIAVLCVIFAFEKIDFT